MFMGGAECGGSKCRQLPKEGQFTIERQLTDAAATIHKSEVLKKQDVTLAEAVEK